MDWMTAVLAIASGFGLSAASGLNAYIPLLTLGICHRFGVLTLVSPYDHLGNEWILLTIAVIGILDFIGDKVPVVDHVLHAAGMLVHPVAGAIVFANQAGIATNIQPVVGLAAGCLIAGGVHVARSAFRPIVTVGTAGVGNSVMSLFEDAVAALTTLFAIVMPIFTAVAIVAVFIWLSRWWWRKSHQRTGTATESPVDYSTQSL